MFTGRFTSDYDPFTAIYVVYAAYLLSDIPGKRAAPQSLASSKQPCVFHAVNH